MTSNAQKIADWRLANPDTRITVPTLLEILGLETLRVADLRWADLSWADLCGADLRWVNLCGADLRWADMRWANLRRANLRRANLSGANLHWANLSGYMPLKTPSGEGDIRATPDGWRVNIGCWKDRTLSDLKALITDEAEWPKATGAEREDRRPFLIAVAALMEAQAAYYPHLITDLAEKWKTES